jgi:DNA-binding XRE family transcriptional regulator
MKLKAEIWKDIEDYGGVYKISSNGQVKSFNKKWKPRILKPRIRGKGYLSVVLTKDGKEKSHSVHRLVAKTFIKNQKNKPQVNHKNGNKLNNDVKNLEWCTNKENMEHATKNNLTNKGEKHPKSKLTANKVIKIKKLYKNKRFTQTELAKKYGVSVTSIRLIIIGKNWSHL